MTIIVQQQHILKSFLASKPGLFRSCCMLAGNEEGKNFRQRYRLTARNGTTREVGLQHYQKGGHVTAEIITKLLTTTIRGDICIACMEGSCRD